MDDDRILALKIEDPDLKESAVRRRADEHRELVSDVLADRVSYRMLDVLVRGSVPARRRAGAPSRRHDGSPILI
jgi:hypothetical protein